MKKLLIAVLSFSTLLIGCDGWEMDSHDIVSIQKTGKVIGLEMSNKNQVLVKTSIYTEMGDQIVYLEPVTSADPSVIDDSVYIENATPWHSHMWIASAWKKLNQSSSDTALYSELINFEKTDSIAEIGSDNAEYEEKHEFVVTNDFEEKKLKFTSNQ